LKLVHAAAISTAVVIALGIAMIAPTFVQPAKPENNLRILVSFSVIDYANVSQWCTDLSSILKTKNIKSAVFFTGKVAEQNPECVTVFDDDVDIGSQTYSYVNLSSISDYTVQLDEVRKGKFAVDDVGQLCSKLFRAPYGSTDGNIYSLLSESGIVADFSYENQYNVFISGQFIKFDTTSYKGSEYSADFFKTIPKTERPIILTFDNTTPISQIDDLLSELQKSNVQFINASETTGLSLTQRG